MGKGQMDGREYVNEDSSLQPELKEIGLDFLNKDDEAILDGTGGEAKEQGDFEKNDISDSGEITQHKEEDEEGEEGYLELINRGDNDEDSDEESDNEEEMEVDKDEEDTDEALPIEKKGRAWLWKYMMKWKRQKKGNICLRQVWTIDFRMAFLTSISNATTK
eukprot:3438104-Ditylum_brightwellii.AAC.1